MKIKELLYEKPVQSSWITDLIYNRPNKILTMRLSNGKTYSVFGISRRIFEKWTQAASKGRYFQNNIRNIYQVKRIK